MPRGKIVTKGDGGMSTLAQYLEKNRKTAYEFASQNTQCDASGRAIISKNDDWRYEPEWDDLFLELSKRTNEGES